MNDIAPEAAGLAGKTAPIQQRIRAVFLSPSSLPRVLGPGFPWLDVLLISTVVAMLGVLTIPDSAFVDPMLDPVTRRGEPVEVTSSPEVIARWGRIMGMLAAVATHPAVAIALAGAFTGIFTILLRGPIPFRDFLSIVSHLLLIPALGTLISVVIALISGDPGGVETAAQASDGLRLVLSIDPFVIWMLIALGFVVAAADSRRSAIRSGIVLVVLYLVLSMAGSTLLTRMAETDTTTPAAGEPGA